MTLTIELAPEIEQLLNQAAAREGQDPATFARAAAEEKLQSVARSAGGERTASDHNAATPATVAPATVTPAVASSEEPMLDQMLAGLTGIIHSNQGRGGSQLSERNGEDFAHDLSEKQRQGHL
jgi:hypothetical protein